MVEPAKGGGTTHQTFGPPAATDPTMSAPHPFLLRDTKVVVVG